MLKVVRRATHLRYREKSDRLGGCGENIILLLESSAKIFAPAICRPILHGMIESEIAPLPAAIWAPPVVAPRLSGDHPFLPAAAACPSHSNFAVSANRLFFFYALPPPTSLANSLASVAGFYADRPVKVARPVLPVLVGISIPADQ